MDLLKLLREISSTPVGTNMHQINEVFGMKMNELNNLLTLKNGFELFEGSLRFLTSDIKISRNIFEWNRKIYSLLRKKMFFFAENILGDGFCFFEGKIGKYDFEIGEFEFISDCMEGFLEEVLSNYNYYSGYSIAVDWQSLNGKILFDQILMPKIPFIMGGDYDLKNLYLSNIEKGLRFKIDLCRKLNNFEDGSKVKISIK